MNPESPDSRRVLALDALRGLAILLMVFSGRIPFGTLPDWMYHAQVPPPGHIFNPNLPGITWVDLVFPFFLFSMGAAIPLSLHRRIERGDSIFRIVPSVISRGVLLAAFAIYVMHIRPWIYAEQPTWQIWLFSLTGFILLFPMYAQVPASWSRWLRVSVRVGGWGGAAILMATLHLPDGSGFSLSRSDIIILVLSNVAVAGALLWLLTQKNTLLRLGLLGILIAIRLAAPVDGWVHWLWDATPAPWLYKLYYLQYLFLVIPGTVAGDMLLQWMKSGRAPGDESRWSVTALVGLASLTLLLNVALVVGLKMRWTVETTLVAAAMLGAASVLVKHAKSSTEILIRNLIHSGVFWVVLGLVFEPYEGGIKKDHPTMSYYFVTGGLAIVTLVFFVIVMEVFRHRKPFSLLVESGQNPLVAYAGINSLVPPVLGLVGVDTILESLTASPWLGVLRGALMTYLVALAASFCTKKKIFLKT